MRENSSDCAKNRTDPANGFGRLPRKLAAVELQQELCRLWQRQGRHL